MNGTKLTKRSKKSLEEFSALTLERMRTRACSQSRDSIETSSSNMKGER
jgi:hypothetical protein